jgi:hypothetical protein
MPAARTGILAGAIALAAAAAACFSGSADGAGTDPEDSGGASPDANAPDSATPPDAMDATPVKHPPDGGGGAHDAAPDHEAGGVPEAGCAPPVNPVVETDPDGPGYDCMQAGCHRPGGTVQGGLTITVSGTLYDAKGQPLPGATVYVTDAAGNLVTLTSDTNANFWSGTSDGTVMPAGAYGTCLPYTKLYPPSQYEGAAQCASAVAVGALQAASVSMCPEGTKACTGLGNGSTNGECHDCHGTSGSPPAIVLP